MAKLHNKIDVITWILLIIVLISNVVSISSSICSRNDILNIVKSITDSDSNKVDYNKIDTLINKSVDVSIKSINIQELINKSVNDKVASLNLKDGVDGIDGAPGKDSVSTQTTIIEKTLEQVPVNGVTPIPRCNKGRWEISFDNRLHWIISFDEDNKIVKCSI